MNKNFVLPLLLALLLPGLALGKTSSPPAVQANVVINDIIKSDNDDRSYRYLQLPNRMQVLLISDPKTEKSAVSLDVNIGSSSDLQDRPGLAHFLEHMLFLGTQKYPKAGEYQEYISAHSGNNNAYTSIDHTNYHFDIDPVYLEPALDRFAQFFIAPTLDDAYVDRERNAVHSEYKARIKDEGRRGWDVLAEIASPASKSVRFSVGSLDTLSDENKPGGVFHRNKIRNDLLRFHQNYYSANVMALVILGKEPLDQLEVLAQKYFASVADKKVELPTAELPLFDAGFLPKKVYIKPLQEQRTLSLYFPMPVYEQWYHEKPLEYISYLLGHEAKGTARDILRSKGWIESLFAGPYVSDSQSAMFGFSVVLTQEGYRHQGEIIDILYGAIAQLKKDGVEKWRYNEQAVINDTSFRFQEKGDAYGYAATLANNLHYFQPRDVISGTLVMSNYDETLIRRYLSYLTPDNALLCVSAPDVPVTKTSTYYQTQYSLAPVSDEELKRWGKISGSAGLKLPAPNEYVAKQFKIKKNESSAAVPVLLRSNANMRLWFKQDGQFNVPKGGIYIYARSARSTDTVQGAALTEIFVRLLNDTLNSTDYSASLADLNLSIRKRSRGVEIGIMGYSDKQGLLLTRVLEAVASPSIRQKDFDNVKEQLLRELENRDKQTPYAQVGAEMVAVVSLPDYSNKQYLAAVNKIRLQEVQAFSLSWLNSLNVDILIHGNFTESDALKLTAIIDSKLLLNSAAHPDPKTTFVQLPDNKTGFIYSFDVDHRDVAVLHYLQGSETSIAEQARLQLLAQLMETAFYQQLRTEQQLGYVVSARYMRLGHVPSLGFLVQSPTYSAEVIDERINEFVASFANTLMTMPANDFERHRAALLKTIEEKPRNLGEEGAEFWSQIDTRQLNFDLREQLLAQIKLLDQKAMADYYWKTFLSPNVHRLVVVTTSKEKPLEKKLGEKYQPIADIDAFKKEQKYFVLK